MVALASLSVSPLMRQPCSVYRQPAEVGLGSACMNSADLAPSVSLPALRGVQRCPWPMNDLTPRQTALLLQAVGCQLSGAQGELLPVPVPVLLELDVDLPFVRSHQAPLALPDPGDQTLQREYPLMTGLTKSPRCRQRLVARAPVTDLLSLHSLAAV